MFTTVDTIYRNGTIDWDHHYIQAYLLPSTLCQTRSLRCCNYLHIHEASFLPTSPIWLKHQLRLLGTFTRGDWLEIYMANIVALPGQPCVLNSTLLRITDHQQLFLTVLSPWQWFCSTRTFSNSLETTLTVMALQYWPRILMSSDVPSQSAVPPKAAKVLGIPPVTLPVTE